MKFLHTIWILLFFLTTVQGQGEGEILERLDIEGISFIKETHYGKDGFIYFVMFGTYVHNEVSINGEIIDTPFLPDHSGGGNDYFHFLVKANKDFEILDMTYFQGCWGDIFYLENEIVFHIKNLSKIEGYFLMNDTVISFDSNTASTIIKLDYNLNYIEKNEYEGFISNITMGLDGIIFIEMIMDDDFTHYVYKGDTLENYYRIEEDGYQNYSDYTPLILTYDTKNDSIINAKRFGSYNDCSIRFTSVDDDGNLVVCGKINNKKWFTFNGVDTIDLYSSQETEGNWYINKFDKHGNHLDGRLLPIEISSGYILDFKVYENDIYFSVRYYRRDFLIDDIEFNTASESANSNGYLIKLDGETGEAIWGYEVDGIHEEERIQDIDVTGGVIMINHLTVKGFISIDGHKYSTKSSSMPGEDQKFTSYIWLDTKNGELLDFRTFYIDGRNIHTRSIKQIEKGIYDVYINVRWRDMIYGEALGIGNTIYESTFHVLRISNIGKTVSNVNVPNPTNINIYPNPAADRLYIDEVPYGSNYVIFDMTGKKVSEGKVTSSGISTHSLLAGSYIINIENHESKLIFIE